MPCRSAAIRIGGWGSGGGIWSRKPFTSKESKVSVTFSPLSAWRINFTTSRVRLYGSSKGMPFQFSTITFEEVPTPITKRPGAASARLAALCARRAGPRVKAGMIAIPRRISGAERGEPVVSPRFGGPEVRVAEVGQLEDPVAVLVEGNPADREGHAEALHHASSFFFRCFVCLFFFLPWGGPPGFGPPLLATFAQVSRSVAVRLRTMDPGALSGSTQ